MTSPTENDMRIAAYLDGAMSDKEQAEFERELAADERLAEQVACFSSNDALLREAMAVSESSTMDRALLEKMGLAEDIGADANGSGTLARPSPANDNSPFWQRWDFRAAAALAASLALVLVITLQGSNRSSLGDALESTPSGQSATLDGDAQLTPILTFAAGDGRFCREFTYATAGEASSGIACRDAVGWSLEAWSDGAVELPDDSEIELASGADTKDLDSAYARLEASDPIAMEREREMIARGWPAN